jgi:hydrogenase maturation factor HypE
VVTVVERAANDDVVEWVANDVKEVWWLWGCDETGVGCGETDVGSGGTE